MAGRTCFYVQATVLLTNMAAWAMGAFIGFGEQPDLMMNYYKSLLGSSTHFASHCAIDLVAKPYRKIIYLFLEDLFLTCCPLAAPLPHQVYPQ